MKKIKKILIRFPNWLGDIVMALPLLEALRIHYPTAEIHALVKKPFHTLLESDPRVNKVISFDLPKTLKQKAFPFKLASLLKQEHYDLAFVCTRSVSSALLLKLANIPKVIGLPRILGRWLLTHQVPCNKTEHQRAQYLALLQGLDINHTSIKASLLKEISSSSTMFDSSRPFILLHPGASYGSSKTWPLEYYETLARLIVDQLDIQVVFLGDVSQKKTTLIHPLICDLTGLTTLDDLHYLIQKTTLIICNDSGPMHIADGCNTPLLALFGSTDPALTGPIGDNSHIIFNKVSCGPCFTRVCPLDHACMKGIKPDVVFEKVKTILGIYGPS
jgi:heptosyltransferase-2